jgi:ABC-type multidrug transport system fused ATPase/permease subunit
MSRVQNDVGTLQDLFTSGILSTIGDLLTLTGIVVVMLFLHLQLTLITLTVVPLMVLLTMYWRDRSRRAFQLVRAALAQVNAGLQESISGVRVIQSLCSEGNNLRRFDALNREHFTANLSASRLQEVAADHELIGVFGIALVVVLADPWSGRCSALAVWSLSCISSVFRTHSRPRLPPEQPANGHGGRRAHPWC